MNKEVNIWDKFLPIDVMQAISFVWPQWRKQHLSFAIFSVLCLNVIIALVVYAANGIIEPRSAWAIGILGFITIAVVIDLFVFILQPERF